MHIHTAFDFALLGYRTAVSTPLSVNASRQIIIIVIIITIVIINVIDIVLVMSGVKLRGPMGL